MPVWGLERPRGTVDTIVAAEDALEAGHVAVAARDVAVGAEEVVVGAAEVAVVGRGRGGEESDPRIHSSRSNSGGLGPVRRCRRSGHRITPAIARLQKMLL